VSDPTTHRLRRWVTGDLFGLTSTITTEIDSYLYLEELHIDRKRVIGEARLGDTAGMPK
jgi:hypothetical protein